MKPHALKFSAARGARTLLWLTTGMLLCAPAQAQATLPSSTNANPAQVPPAVPVRQSTITVPFEASEAARELVVAQSLPAGAAYLPGSATLNGQPLADPATGTSGRLYWTLPSTPRGVIAYRVQHEGRLGELPAPALLVRYPRERHELLMGQLDLQDLAGARTPAAQPGENAGAIKLPLHGSVYRERDRISVDVELPADQAPDVRINGERLPEHIIGKRVVNAATQVQRLTFVGVPLRSGINVISVADELVQVVYANATTRVEVTPQQLVADGASPLRLKFRALDDTGTLTGQRILTVRSNLEPRTPDADPIDGGYQLNLSDGEGVLELAPQALPTRLVIDVLVRERVVTQVFDVTPDPSHVAIGGATMTVGLSSPFQVHWNAAAYDEGMLGAGKLYLALSSAGLPTSPSPTERYPVYGDASGSSVPLQGIDPIAFRYEHPDFQAQYRQAPLPISVFQVGLVPTALSASTRGATRLSGFAAMLPRERVTETLTPDGTRLLHLSKGPISPDSEAIELVTRDKFSGIDTRRILLRYLDYTLDPQSGTLAFVRPVEPFDLHLNPQRVEVTYRTSAPLNNRALAWGAQLTHEQGAHSVAVAVTQIDGIVSSGVGATYREGAFSASTKAAISGGLQVSAGVQYTTPVLQTGAVLNYQQSGYTGLNPTENGLRASAFLGTRFTEQFGAQLDAQIRTDATTSGSTTTLVTYNARPFLLGVGARADFATHSTYSAVGAFGYHQHPFDFDVKHAQPFNGAAAITSLSSRYALAPNVHFALRDEFNWQSGHQAALGLETRLGTTNLQVAYDLPTVNGAGSRARFGADTTLGLSSTTSLDLRGSATRDFNSGRNDLSLGTAWRYSAQGVSATLGNDFSVQAGAFKDVLRGGLSASISGNLTLGADGTVELSRTPGQRFAVSYAYRGGLWNTLGYLRYQNGSLAGGQAELLSEISAEYHRFNYALRGALDTRYQLGDAHSFTYQPSLGATWYVNDLFGVGASGRALLQPGTGTAQYSLGLEGSLRALPGTWVTLGYNVLGFDGIGATYTRPGAYLRLSVLLDETHGGGR